MRQRKQRDKLAKAVAVAEQQFKQVQEEILYLESPFDPEELERLDTTISLLRKEIQYISNLPDNSSGIGKNLLYFFWFFCLKRNISGEDNYYLWCIFIFFC